MSYRLSNYLQQNKILYEFQFGFRKHYSTILALMEVIDNIYYHLDEHEYVIGIFFDLRKAFDTMNMIFCCINCIIMVFEGWYINGLKVIFVNDDSLLPLEIQFLALVT